VLTTAEALSREYWAPASASPLPIAQREREQEQPSLVAPTLEIAFSNTHVRSFYMQQMVFNVAREQALCTQARTLLVELARLSLRHARTAEAVQAARQMVAHAFAHRSADEQLLQAKLRFYAKLAIVGMPIHARAADLAATALWLWTAAFAELACPTEQHVRNAIAQFELPVAIGNGNSDAMPPAPPPVPAPPSFPLFVCDAEARALLEAGYARRVPRSPEARAALDADVPGAWSANGRHEQVRSTPITNVEQQWRMPAGTSAAIDPALPICFFVRLRAPPPPTQLLDRLLDFLAADLLVARPPLGTRLSIVHKAGADSSTVLFGVQELVCADLAQQQLVGEQWAGRCHLDLVAFNSNSNSNCDIVPHLPAPLYAPQRLRQPIGTPYRGPAPPDPGPGPDPNPDRRQDAQLEWRDFGRWLADRVEADVVRIRGLVETRYNCKPRRYMRSALCQGMEDVFRGVMRQLGGPLQTSLIALTTPSTASASSSSSSLSLSRSTSRAELRHSANGSGARDLPPGRSLAHMPQYAQLQARIAANRELLCAFFTDLVAPTVIQKSTATDIRAGTKGSLKLNVGAKYQCRWIDFSGGSGPNLLTLVRHVKPDFDESAAFAHMLVWADRHAPVDANAPRPSSESPAAAAAPDETIAERLASARTDVGRCWGRSIPLKEPDAVLGCRYLRERRGLRDVDRALIELNPSIGFSVREPCSEPPGSRKPALLFFTTTRSAVQRIFLADGDPPNKATDMQVAKMTRGALRLDAQRRDTVCVRAPPAADYSVVCVAEGPETALSVAAALPPHIGVHATLGVGNIEHFGSTLDPVYARLATVVWCRENDAAQRPEAIARTTAALKTRFARVLEWAPPPQYNDFNDVHQRNPGAEGSRIIAESFAQLHARQAERKRAGSSSADRK
jgi:hypothetical protein